MSEEKKMLIEKARKIYKKIYPCGKKRSWRECFTRGDNYIIFWFDTEDESTHVLTEYIYK